MFKIAGRQREMGLGSKSEVSLARARELAAETRQAPSDGKDPLRARQILVVKTFGEVANAYVEKPG